MNAESAPEPAAPAGPIVWVIDADHWPRALLVGELAERGYDAYGFADIAGALVALHARGRKAPALAVIELAGTDAEQADLRQLAARDVRLVGLSNARSARSPLARELPWSALIRRPCTIGEVADRVESLLAS